MSQPDALSVLNPSILGQAEKAHNAVLDRVLAGTSLDEHQWITLQLAIGAGGSITESALVARISNAAKFRPAVVETAIAALVDAGLLDRTEPEQLTVSTSGASLVAELRAKVTDYISGAYEQISQDDLATAGRVLKSITASLSDELARRSAD